MSVATLGASRRRRRAAGSWVAVALVISLACGCAHAGPPPADAATYGARIDINTPQGLHAKQTLDMVNSDWPIGPVGVRTLAVPAQVDNVVAALDRLWWDRPIKVTNIDVGAGEATLHTLTSYGAAQDIELRTKDGGLVDRFKVTIQPPPIHQWADIDAELTKSGARYAYQVSKVSDGKCTKLAGSNVDQALPLASIFKLYVLLAVADAVNAGTLSWTDQLTITAEDKAVGSAGFDHLAPGSTVSVRDAAQQMISASDNMATDLLIGRLGPGAVDRALVAAGHHDPGSMTPFPTAHQLFAIGWGNPDIRKQWQEAVEHGGSEGRARVLELASKNPYDPDPYRTHTPAAEFGAEWFGTATDICRVHAALQKAAVGPAAPVRDILSATPGIDLNPSNWRYIGAKGGNLPGDLTFSWYAEDRTGQAWVTSFQLNWQKYRSLAAAEWLLSIAKQAFGLIPVG